MSQIEKYREIFERVFNTADEPIGEMKYRKTEGWNSIGHMMLMAEIEEEFGIKLSTEDIMEFHSYEKGIAILRQHEIEL